MNSRFRSSLGRPLFPSLPCLGLYSTFHGRDRAGSGGGGSVGPLNQPSWAPIQISGHKYGVNRTITNIGNRTPCSPDQKTEKFSILVQISGFHHMNLQNQ